MKKFPAIICIILIILVLCFLSVHVTERVKNRVKSSVNSIEYDYKEYPLERNNVKLHLDRIEAKGINSGKNILLLHGVTYSSNEFDIDYEDYSLARALAREGYSVWKLDLAGYGRSGALTDGFLMNSDYAVDDISAAAEKISKLTGQNKIDLFGWSWGTVNAAKFASKHSECIDKLVLYAPILSGIGKCDVAESFHHNTWAHAAEDFQRNKKGDINYLITDPIVAEMWCSSCWHYDGDKSPNGGRREICVDKSEKLIDLSVHKAPTLIICGDKDPYINYELISSAKTQLPKGSDVQIIKGGSHVVFMEKPYHKDFQEKLIRFLKS